MSKIFLTTLLIIFCQILNCEPLYLDGENADKAKKIILLYPALKSNISIQQEIISEQNKIISAYSNELNVMFDQTEFLKKQIPSEKKKRFTRGYVIASTGYIVIDIIATVLIIVFGVYK
jgi:hypothetical protein